MTSLHWAWLYQKHTKGTYIPRSIGAIVALRNGVFVLHNCKSILSKSHGTTYLLSQLNGGGHARSGIFEQAT
jgi:hypothetical protein